MNKHKFHLVVLVLLVAGWLMAGPAQALETNGATTVAGLTGRLEAHLAEPRFHGALWGVKIVSLTSGKTIFENHADRLMSPASNSKLYTGALALDHFGADYRIVTPILATAKPDADGTVRGDLVIAGRGDPSWNARHVGTNFWNLFTPFVAVLTNAGVRHVTGDLIGDNTFFHSPPQGGSWTVDDLENSEGAEISALTLADNFTQIRVTPGAHAGEPCNLTLMDPFTGLQLDNQTVTLTNGAERHIVAHRFRGEPVVHLLGGLPAGGEPEIVDMPVLRPAEWFAAALKEALRRNGIIVDGSARSVAWPSPPRAANVKLGEVVSPPMRELVHDFMKPSQNLETDLIFEHTGEMSRATNTPLWWTSEDCALAALAQFFATNDLPAGDVHFDEGSGLSRNNLTTANATVALLQFMTKHRAAKDFLAALPIAGVDGTLRRRMKDTPAFQNVHAKTGTLRWANALSGFVTTAAGEPLVFSLMLNRYDSPPDRKRTAELDDIAVMLASFTDRTDAPLESQYAPLGTLLVTQFISAPFPHAARAEGHKYHDEFYSAADHYSNSTVAMFIPKNFRPKDKVDFVLHFHGWNNTVAGTLNKFDVIEQFAASGKNAVLIVPEGPYNTPDSFGGKLEDSNGFKIFMTEAVAKLSASGVLAKAGRGLQPASTSDSHFVPEGRAPEIGDIILSGHSGGYHVMSAIVDRGGLSENIKEVWLFDALYGGTENFVAWQKREHGRLLDIYTDHGGTKDESENLMAFYRTNGVSYFSAEGTNVVADNLLTNRLVFLHSDMTHNDVFARRETFEQFLKTSCLPNE